VALALLILSFNLIGDGVGKVYGSTGLIARKVEALEVAA